MIGKLEDLTNTVITADALNTQKDTARAIVDRGGEYCIQVKDNQKTIRQEAELSAKEPFKTLRPCRLASRTPKPA